MNKKITSFLFLIISIQVCGQNIYNITFNHDGKTVNGVFTTPKDTGKFTTIIINPGSGSIDRNGTLPLTDGNSACLFPSLYGDTLFSYKELSDALVKAGYAVLRYDKLEYSYPTTLGTITFHKLWLPVESAINFAKTRSYVDTNKIILIGHSEGSSLIPHIAKNRKDIKALISIAGARTPFDSLYAWQLNNLIKLLRPCGATKNDSINAANQASQILDYFNVIRSNSWNSSTPAAFGVPASAWYDYIRAIDLVSENYNINKLPSLFLGMGLDIQVPPSELLRFKNEVHVTNDFWSIPGLIHNMVPNNNPHVSKNLTDTIIYWLSKQSLTSIKHYENMLAPSISVSPNPFSSTVKIDLNKLDPVLTELDIKDIYGQTVLSAAENKWIKTQGETIDLSYLPNGVYFIQLNFNGISITKKIVKLGL